MALATAFGVLRRGARAHSVARMHVLVVAALVLAAGLAAAGDRRRGRADLDVVVPVVPEEHERLHFFDRQEHHALPGTVTINASPYVCDRDKSRFDDRDEFLYHIRTAHGVDASRAARWLVQRKNRLHFVAE